MIYGILLAAGNSKRYGCNKLLEKLKDGQTLAEKAGSKLIACVDKAVAVVRINDTQLAYRLELLGFEVIYISNLGMGFSLSSAVNYIQGAKGYIVCLADMPFIQQETIKDIAALLAKNKSIVVPCYNKKRGHPVGFNSEFKNEISQLNGDIGAKNIINKYNNEVFEYNCSDAGIVIDVDTREDMLLMYDWL